MTGNSDRVTEVPVEPWDISDFKKVIQKGSKLLNVDFSSVENQLIADPFDSIGVVQEICKNCCINAGVSKTSDAVVKINQNTS